MKSKLLLVIACLVYLVSAGQDPYYIETSEPLQADTSFKKRYQDDAYNYERKTPKKEAPKELPKINPPSTDFSGIATVIFYVVVGLLALLVLYMIYEYGKDFKLGSKRVKNKPIATRSQNEQDIVPEEELDKSDLLQQIAQAKQNEDFPLAIRFYFLLYLEKLQDQKAITYHRDKTNQDYLAEIKEQHIAVQFTKLSYPYEYVWYGKKPVDHATFTQLEYIYTTHIQSTK